MSVFTVIFTVIGRKDLQIFVKQCLTLVRARRGSGRTGLNRSPRESALCSGCRTSRRLRAGWDDPQDLSVQGMVPACPVPDIRGCRVRTRCTYAEGEPCRTWPILRDPGRAATPPKGTSAYRFRRRCRMRRTAGPSSAEPGQEHPIPLLLPGFPRDRQMDPCVPPEPPGLRNPYRTALPCTAAAASTAFRREQNPGGRGEARRPSARCV